MAGEKRYVFMDNAGTVLETSMCLPEFVDEWAALHGFDKYEDMDRGDGKARMLETVDVFNTVSGTVQKGVGKAAYEAFWKSKGRN